MKSLIILILLFNSLCLFAQEHTKPELLKSGSTRENSSMPEDFWRTNEFNFENGKVLNGKERFCFSGKMNGIFGKTDKEYRESFNKSLNSEFVEKYVIELFVKIKNYR